MPVEYVRWIERDDLRARPDCLFVFGDNLERVGLGGQAKSMRGEPNAVGLPTKRNPWTYLRDMDLLDILESTGNERRRLMDHVAMGGTVIWPEMGIGTGLSKLDKKAPSIFAFWEAFREDLERG